MRASNLDIFDEDECDLAQPVAGSPAYLTIQNLTKEFQEHPQTGMIVFSGIDLQVTDGEFVAIYGANGCGKTTLVRILAGLDDEWDGQITIGGATPENADCGYVFQDFQRALLPWLNYLENLCLPLEIARGTSHAESVRKVYEFLKDVQIDDGWLTKYPHRSNAGEQQLASLLRAFLFSPRLVLLDEPFSSLDFHHQLRLREMLLSLWQETKQTVLFISHSLEDSIYLADRLVVFSPKPSRIILNYRVPFSRPRTPALLKSRQFSETVSEVRHLFLKESL
jgi:NitT/TauT family transport system ATP-binding protein